MALNNAVVTSLHPELAERTESVEDIAAWLSSDVAGDPLLFAQQAFAWGEGELSNSSGPEPWQAIHPRQYADLSATGVSGLDGHKWGIRECRPIPRTTVPKPNR